MYKSLILMLIPIFSNIGLLLFSKFSEKNEIYSSLYLDSNIFIYISQNLFYNIILYPIIAILIYWIIYKPFYDGLIINIMTYPINRMIYFLIRIVFCFIMIIVLNIINVVFLVYSHNEIFENLIVSNQIIETAIYSVYSQLTITFVIICLCFNRDKHNLIFTVVIFMLLSNVLAYILNANSQLWSLIPSVMIQMLSIPEKVSLSISNLSIGINFLYIVLLGFIFYKKVRKMQL